jgi:uncharacterized damage-inducible protein DinB
MRNDRIELIAKMFEYNRWANTRLIEICSELTDEQLAIERKGVMGSIHPTLVHIIRAEGNYLNRLAGSRPWADEPDWDKMPMGGLLEMAHLSGKRLIAVAGEADPAIRHDVEFQGKPFHFFNWTVLLQALYHGIEHRTQIKFLLTQLSVPHPDLAAWDYLDSLDS